VRVKLKDLVDAGIERVPRTMGVKNGLPLLADGHTLDVKNVIWCTGYQNGFPWIDLPIYGDDDGNDPIHQDGVVTNVPGMYFVGLHFLYAMSSTMIHGVGRDAEHVARSIAAKTRSARAA
jgi:putative flavoprotein involved in K+ transport